MGSRPRRVAVVSPQTRLALARRRHTVLTDVPHLATADVARARRVYRLQLRRALGALGALAALLLGLPLLIALAPGLLELRVVGIPAAWLAVAVLPYAVLVPLARWQLGRAERVERGGPDGGDDGWDDGAAGDERGDDGGRGGGDGAGGLGRGPGERS